jgi:hypothetical protein
MQKILPQGLEGREDSMNATRKQVIEIITEESLKLRDSGKMYQPVNAHFICEWVRKRGLKQPEGFIEWRVWLKGLRLRGILLKLHHSGVMVQGMTHITRHNA